MEIVVNFITGVSVGFEFKDTSHTFLVSQDENLEEGLISPNGVLTIDLFIIRVTLVW